MPLDEEGAKWSCEPCIRGHRSSKCQHFDRLMMKVPKAGRPLAKCPHPKGTCSCRKTYAVMVRIPKGSTCMCRPLYEVPVDHEPDYAPTSSSATPVTIAPAATPNSVAPTPSPAPGKVQKAGRRQSNIQAAPGNIARALESMSNMESQKPENGVPGYFPPHASHGQRFPVAYDSLGQQQPAMHHQVVTSTSPQNSSCCSGNANKTKVSPEQPKSQGSCCAKKEPQSDEVTGAKSELGGNGNANFSNGLPFTSCLTPPSLPSWQNFHSPTNGDMFHTFTVHRPQAPTPVYFSPYTATHSTPNFAYPNIPHNIGFSQPTMPVFPANQQPQSFSYVSPTSCGESTSEHVCHCGDGCQCLGCASHPFNKTTKQHVQEMGLMVGLNGEGQQQPSPYSTNPTSTQLDYSVSGMHQSLSAGVQPNTVNPYSGPTAHQFGDGYAPHTSYRPDQELMEPSQYYTLEYPVGLPNPCSDVTGSCQCGNDCSCVGCVTHSGHNGFGLEPGSTESTGFHSTPSAQHASQDVSRDFSAPSPSL